MPPELMLKRMRVEKRMQWVMPVLAFLSFLVIWQLGYNYAKFLPSPSELTEQFNEFIRNSETYMHIGVTLRRLLIGLFMGIVIGTVAALLSRFNSKMKSVMDVYVFIALTVPSMAVAFISLMLFGISELGVYVAVAVITFPFITITLQDGLKTLDKGQLEMAKVYQIRRFQIFRQIILPYMYPYFFAAIRNTHALGWKVVVVAEVFSVRTGIGFQFNHAFDSFSIGDVLIWLLFFLGVVLFLEYVVLRQIEKRVFHWRDGNGMKMKKTVRGGKNSAA